ncbi:TadE/TadG family type IV pilus assembly protein, partial [Rhizobium ruizarguesonis]
MRAELERPLFDGAFWSSILHSRTFWFPEDHGALLGTFAIAMLLLASMLLLPRLSARRRRISELHGDTSGSTTMMDFVLVTPVFVFFMFVVFQFTILAKNHLFTHYAAYAAARSARVYFCPALPITIRSLIDVKTCDDDAAAGKA